MDSNEIRDKILNKEYETDMEYPKESRFSSNHIFDEEQSVRWNREEVERRNAEIENKKDEYRKARGDKFDEFVKDVKDMLIEHYNINENKEIADKIYNKGYEDGHSGGMYEILNIVEDYGDFAEDIIKIIK